MQVKAKAKFIRMSPRKTRLVVNAVRGLVANEALDQLKFIKKRAAKPISKLISSAMANAEHNFELKKDNLYIKEIRVDEGATMHRWKPRARGRATPIRKRTNHINLILDEIEDSGIKQGRKQDIEDPIKLDKKKSEVKDSDKIVNKKDKKDKDKKDEKDKEIIDPRRQGHGKNTKIEGGSKKGFVNKVFRRKSG